MPVKAGCGPAWGLHVCLDGWSSCDMKLAHLIEPEAVLRQAVLQPALQGDHVAPSGRQHCQIQGKVGGCAVCCSSLKHSSQAVQLLSKCMMSVCQGIVKAR